jgi:hypothetical protein
MGGGASIKTQPKGAQVRGQQPHRGQIFSRDFYLNPGTYVNRHHHVGFKPVHRVIDVEKSGKVRSTRTLTGSEGSTYTFSNYAIAAEQLFMSAHEPRALDDKLQV